ncbi:MAG TPA: bifunctional 3,4-dihydroxy-2-butanone-4-phosphate synthase/GTP cyclohydrolase II [Candidatus Polarisedimenticolaceae bacterium]|nr:bifunctional 3,4-dihydroxy-2-butanone-4-phosphate synthase/GTP cyclohydrolase II [Candidatus Polarisedimenticolaceae bacterium]
MSAPTYAPKFATVEQALDDLRAGRMIVILDDEDRENEGDLACAAQFVTPEIVNFMATHGRGLICLPMSAERLDALDIRPMVEQNTARRGTAFCVSIEARRDVTTGISAADRARTIRVAVDERTRPDDLARPGHVFPLRARPGGVLKRAGHTEAIVDLCRLAGLAPAGVVCEIMNADGTMARLPELLPFAAAHDLKLLTIADLIRHRMRTERLVTRVASPQLPTDRGTWTIHAFHTELEDRTHVALVMGDPTPEEPTLVRVHSECLTGDVFGSSRCDCGAQLHRAMEMIEREGRGAILYLRQEGRGIGLANKLRAYELQDSHHKDTVEANLALGFRADHRDYGVGAQILYDLGIRRLRLMTNNPGKYVALKGYGLELVERVPLEAPAGTDNRRYLETKKQKLGHLLESV